MFMLDGCRPDALKPYKLSGYLAAFEGGCREPDRPGGDAVYHVALHTRCSIRCHPQSIAS